MRYLESNKDSPSYVIIQAVYDTYDVMPIQDGTSDLDSQPNGRFVFIGEFFF